MRNCSIAVTGIGILCPAGRDVKSFWETVADGRSALGPIASEEFANFPAAVGGEVPDAWIASVALNGDGGDTDRQRRLTRIAVGAAREAISHSGLQVDAIGRDRVGLALGVCQIVGDPGVMDRVACELGIAGPRMLISTACAAGGNAVGAGRDRLWSGEADIMLVGGADILIWETYAGFQGLQALSPEPCAPYSRSDGLNLGEGAAFLVLEPSEAAEERGATVLAHVLGYGLSADAYHVTAPDPSGRGPTTAMRMALGDARIDADDVDYVNGHGTATPANDAVERKVMRNLFGDRAPRVPISSTKSFVGHTLGGAGAIEAVTSVLAIQHGMLPPTANFDEEAEADLDFVPNRARAAAIDVVVSNNYAFGGNNCSVVFSTPTRTGPRRPQSGLEPVAITGIGLVGALGLGVDEWRKALATGRSGIGPIAAFDTEEFSCHHGAEMCSLAGRSFCAPGPWRHMDGLTRQLMAATRLAWDDASLKINGPEREGAAVLFATTFGPITAGLTMSGKLGGGPRLRDFHSVVANAPAGAVCQALGLKGPTTTLTSTPVSAMAAIATAVDHIRQEKASIAVVVASDEFNAALMAARDSEHALAPDGVIRPYDRARCGTVLGAASAALVLESEASRARRGARSYGHVLGTYQASTPSYRVDPVAYQRTLRGALDRAGVAPEDVDFSLASAGGRDIDAFEAWAFNEVFGPGVTVSAPKSLTGECEAASALVNVAVGALAVSEGLLPATANLERPLDEFTVRHVMGNSETRDVDVAVATAVGKFDFGAVVVGKVGRVVA
jgi:3-oxoacyl-[acyl-carrier-protein] synthase II